MTIKRGAAGGDRFVQLLNAAMQDTRLTYRARGVLACIVSMPPSWTGSAEALSEGSPGEGRDAIRTALKELEQRGYMARRRVQGDKGRWTTEWEVSDDPALLAPQTVIPLDITNAQVGPTTDFQASVAQPSVDRPSVDQASSTKHGTQTRSVPYGTGRRASRTPATPADAVAAAVYDHAGGMIPYVAVQQIAKRALRASGSTVESVTAAIVAVYDAGKPVTLQTVGQQLAGRGQRQQQETTDDRVAGWQALKNEAPPGEGPAAIGGGR